VWKKPASRPGPRSEKPRFLRDLLAEQVKLAQDFLGHGKKLSE
jgi:hypothetical protein